MKINNNNNNNNNNTQEDDEKCYKNLENEIIDFEKQINRLPMIIDNQAINKNGDGPLGGRTILHPESNRYHVNYSLDTNNLNTAQNNNNKILRSNGNQEANPKNGLQHSSASPRKQDGKYEDHLLGWHRKTRFHIALLGLLIAVVNCYAQATFCIAIVEMVLPSDFVFRNNSQPSSHLSSSSLSNHGPRVMLPSVGSNKQEPQVVATILAQKQTGSGGGVGDNSCPIELQYRDYYDSWRFPSQPTTNLSSSTPTTYTTLISNNNGTNGNVLDISNRFDWDASRQGLLLGAFAIGTAPLQILGGRLAEIYGAKWVLFAGCIGTAITNLTIPFLAHFSFVLLILNRIVMGLAQAGMEPGLMCLLAEWMTPTETGFFISMLLFAICIGFFLGSLCPSFLLTLGYGWPMTYYVAGGVNLFVSILWLTFASSRPRESRLISREELEFIENEQRIANRKWPGMTIPDLVNGQQQERLPTIMDWNLNISPQNINDNTTATKLYETEATGRNNLKLVKLENPTIIMNKKIINDNRNEMEPEASQAPWINILRTRPVWAFIICKISIRWCADVLGTELPTYLANVLHLSIKLNGIVNSVSSALFAIFSFLTGYVVNRILQNQKTRLETSDDGGGGGGSSITATSGATTSINISKTNLRKWIQSVASFGAAISLFLMTSYDCNLVFSMSMLLVLSCCLVMGTGGELQIPYDMTSKYPGTLHGMACTLSVSGWLAPPLIGLILGDQPSSRYRWNIVWYLTALITLIGGLVFVLFADASPRDFDSSSSSVGPSDDLKKPRRNPRKRVEPEVVGGRRRPIMVAGGPPLRANLEGEEEDQTTLGYYNAACKLADNSPPTHCRNSNSSKRHMNIPHKTCEGFTYPLNGRMNSDYTSTTSQANGNEKEEEEEKKKKEEVWSSNFDSKPIRVRQVEDSFIKPYYLDAFDSVATSVVIFPYRAKASGQPEYSSQRDAADDNDFRNRPEGPAAAKTTGNSPLWSRIWRRRRRQRKFCVTETSDDGLIGGTISGSSSLVHNERQGGLAAAVVEPPEVVEAVAAASNDHLVGATMIKADVLCISARGRQQHPVGRDDEQRPRGKRKPGDQLLSQGPPTSPVSMTTATKTITHL